MRSNDIKSVKIGFSCHKQWSQMDGSESERHCNSCSKAVFNFSNATDDEVLDFLRLREGQSTCGKFDARQLEKLNASLRSNESNIFKPLILGTTIATLTACGTSNKTCDSHDHHETSKVEVLSAIYNADSTSTVIVKGQMLDEDGIPLIGANFVFDDTAIGCITDVDGNFEIEVNHHDLKAETASISYTGYKTLQIPLVDIKNKEVKISMIDMGALLGIVVVTKKPWYKRLWNRVKQIF